MTTPVPSINHSTNHLTAIRKLSPLPVDALIAKESRTAASPVVASAAATTTATSTTAVTQPQQQPTFVRPFEDSFRPTSKPPLRPIVNYAVSTTLYPEINKHAATATVGGASVCAAPSTTIAPHNSTIREGPNNNAYLDVPKSITHHHSSSFMPPYSQPPYHHHMHVPVSHVPSLYKHPHFTPPPPPHQQIPQFSSKMSVAALATSDANNQCVTNGTKHPLCYQNGEPQTTIASHRSDNNSSVTNSNSVTTATTTITNVTTTASSTTTVNNSKCIVNDKVKHINNHVVPAVIKLHDSKNTVDAPKSAEVSIINSANEKSANEVQVKQKVNSNLIVGEAREPLRTEKSIKVSSNDANEKECRKNVDSGNSVEPSIEVSTLPLKPVHNKSHSDATKKPSAIDVAAQIMQSIKSEEVLRTCQNVSNVLLQIPRYQEKLLNFSHGEIKSATALRYTDKCNNVTEFPVKFEPPVLNVPDLSRNFIKHDDLSHLLFLVPETPRELTSTLDMAEKRRKRKRDKVSGNSVCSSSSDSEDDVRDHDLWITKGPPSKPLISKRKLNFLAIFGLTTLQNRNGKCHSIHNHNIIHISSKRL